MMKGSYKKVSMNTLLEDFEDEVDKNRKQDIKRKHERYYYHEKSDDE